MNRNNINQLITNTNTTSINIIDPTNLRENGNLIKITNIISQTTTPKKLVIATNPQFLYPTSGNTAEAIKSRFVSTTTNNIATQTKLGYAPQNIKQLINGYVGTIPEGKMMDNFEIQVANLGPTPTFSFSS